METMELPDVEVEEEEPTTPWLDHAVDLAAFQLWWEACRIESTDEKAQAAGR